MSENIKDKIYLLRKQLGLTLEEVAQVVGVGKSTVRKWETGEIDNMKLDKVELLAKALHTTPAYLMGWEDEPIGEYKLDKDTYLFARKYSELPKKSKKVIQKVFEGFDTWDDEDDK